MKFRSLVAAVFLLLAMSVGSYAADRSWKGWITDSRCGASGAHPGDKECALSCVKKGAKFVLVDDADKKIYVLDSQDKVAPYAGEHVLIKGTAEGHTLRFTSIEPIQ
jgi:hypothetical protein